MTKKKNILIAALISATAIGGAAFAADTLAPQKGPMRADTNGDGVVSRAEFFAAAEADFKAKDANGDRKLSGDEMKDKRGRYARQDTNNDGVLTFEEAAAATAAEFARLDVNKDGKLTPEELAPFGRRGMRGGPDGPGGPGKWGHGGPRGDGGAMMLKRLDTNNDGKISREEMRAEADKRFDRLDTNKDGFIDQAELQAGRDRMKERRGPGRGGSEGPGGPGGPAGDTPPPPPSGGAGE